MMTNYVSSENPCDDKAKLISRYPGIRLKWQCEENNYVRRIYFWKGCTWFYHFGIYQSPSGFPYMLQMNFLMENCEPR